MSNRDVDVVVVGAGFAGMYLVHRMVESGRSVRCFDAATDVGGTWYWNRYPGARCDVESMEYSYDFDEDLQQEWEWTERYAAQPEILRYARHVADRFGLRPHITFETKVAAAHFDEAAKTWTVTTAPMDGSEAERLRAGAVVMATGCLSSANLPDIPGRDSFHGELVHTGRYPKEGVDFSGKRVGIIGTGSSGIQSIPVVAAEADHLTVFQRTAQFTIPARNGPLDPAEQAEIKADYAAFREANRRLPNAIGSRTLRSLGTALETPPDEVTAELERLWELGGTNFLGTFRDMMVDPEANQIAADFVRAKIAEMVDDPETAALLTPEGLIGCKRLVIDSDYYATYNRDDVRLVDVSDGGTPIIGIEAAGVRTSGELHQLDVLIFATGFDAMTGSLLRVDIRGRGGLSLADAWAEGPRTYLGISVPGFPNLFTITGPQSPSVLANMIIAGQQHVDLVMDALDHLVAAGHDTIEATTEATEAWVAHVNSVGDRTIFPSCNSWYVGANIPGKPRVFMPLPGFGSYVRRCDEIVEAGWVGFAFD